MIFNRSVLVLMIVSLPTSMAAAGPIFTHPIQPAGASPWVQGNGSETRAMLSGSGSDFPGGVLWVNVRPSRLETLLTPTPVAAASGAVNPPTVPTVAVPASSSSPGEDSAASSQAGILSVSTTRESASHRCLRPSRRWSEHAGNTGDSIESGSRRGPGPDVSGGTLVVPGPRRPASPITDRPA